MDAVVWALGCNSNDDPFAHDAFNNIFAVAHRGMAVRGNTWRNQRGVREWLLWQPATGKRFWARKMANFVKFWEARQAVMEELFAAAV